MDKLLVLGIDGFDWSLVNIFKSKFPFMHNVWLHENSEDLICLTHPHSAPSWGTIFTGEPQSHIYNFTDDIGPITKDQFSGTWIWEVTQQQEITTGVISVPATIPTINFNWDWNGLFDPLDGGEYLEFNEIKNHSNFIHKAVREAVQENYQLIISVDRFPDQLHHWMGHKFHTNVKVSELDKYSEWDIELNKTVNFAKSKGFDVLLLSDHGLPKPGKKFNGKLHPQHHRQGIFHFSGQAIPKYGFPVDNSEIFYFICDFFQVDPYTIVSNDLQMLYNIRDLDKQIINRRLKALGYIE